MGALLVMTNLFVVNPVVIIDSRSSAACFSTMFGHRLNVCSPIDATRAFVVASDKHLFIPSSLVYYPNFAIIDGACSPRVLMLRRNRLATA